MQVRRGIESIWEPPSGADGLEHRLSPEAWRYTQWGRRPPGALDSMGDLGLQ
jgi:hypothetical protein